MTHEHGAALKRHVTRLIATQAADGSPDDRKNWRERVEDSTGKTYFEHISTGERRRAPPQPSLNVQASLLAVQEDGFIRRLHAMVDLKPKGIIVCQQSWRPDDELVVMPEDLLATLDVPIVMLTYEAGEELKNVANNGST